MSATRAPAPAAPRTPPSTPSSSRASQPAAGPYSFNWLHARLHDVPTSYRRQLCAKLGLTWDTPTQSTYQVLQLHFRGLAQWRSPTLRYILRITDSTLRACPSWTPWTEAMIPSIADALVKDQHGARTPAASIPAKLAKRKFAKSAATPIDSLAPIATAWGPLPWTKINWRIQPFYSVVKVVAGTTLAGDQRDPIAIEVHFTDAARELMGPDSRVVLLTTHLNAAFLSQYQVQDKPCGALVETRTIEWVEVDGGQRKSNPNFVGKLGTLPDRSNPIDVTSLIDTKAARQTIRVKVQHECSIDDPVPACPFVVAVAIVKRAAVEDVVAVLEKRAVSVETRVAELRKDAQSADDDLVETSATVSLRDPLTFARITSPARCRATKHVDCFDAATFLAANEASPSWRCPICTARLGTFPTLTVDDVPDVPAALRNHLDDANLAYLVGWSPLDAVVLDMHFAEMLMSAPAGADGMKLDMSTGKWSGLEKAAVEGGSEAKKSVPAATSDDDDDDDVQVTKDVPADRAPAPAGSAILVDDDDEIECVEVRTSTPVLEPGRPRRRRRRPAAAPVVDLTMDSGEDEDPVCDEEEEEEEELVDEVENEDMRVDDPYELDEDDAMDREERKRLELERLERQRQRELAASQAAGAPSDQARTLQPRTLPPNPAPTPSTPSSAPTKRQRSASPSPAARNEASTPKRRREGEPTAPTAPTREVVVIDSSTDESDVEAVEPPVSTRAERAEPTRPSAPARASTPIAAAGSQAAATPAAGTSVEDATVKYLDGRFLLTTVGPHTQGRLRFTDLIDKKHMQAAILSSYVWEDEWLWPLLPPNIRLCLIVNKDSPPQVPADRAAQTRICVPTMAGFGVMHVKLSLFVYRTFVRMVIASANLISYDWTGMENICFVQDFSKRAPTGTAAGATPAPPPPSEWYTSLSSILGDLQVPESVYRFLQGYDAAKWHGEFIFSRHGSFAGRYGGHALAHAVAKFLPDNATRRAWRQVPLLVDCVGSSLGKMDQAFVDQTRTWLRGSLRVDKDVLPAADNTRVLFPTKESVVKSVYGEPGGGSIWLKKEMWEGAGYPKHFLHTLQSKCTGYLMHCKIICARAIQIVGGSNAAEAAADGDDTSATPPIPIHGIYYAGSHNFTKAAWGTSSKAGKIRAYNYELGVVFPITTASEIGTTFPIPYATPVKYRLGVDEPWLQG
ncbi:hypothetical protein GGF32_004074 [Allomyces javanicus]|nr:hypothetical protein GGF32_004074 [Allomyces javanicus]